MAGEPSFFELGVADAERAKAFYGSLFGWSFAADGAISTVGLPGGVHGGDDGATPSLFFRVDDLDAALTKVREFGGETNVPESSDGDDEKVAKFGRFALCKDDLGSAFGIHEVPATV